MFFSVWFHAAKVNHIRQFFSQLQRRCGTQGLVSCSSPSIPSHTLDNPSPYPLCSCISGITVFQEYYIPYYSWNFSITLDNPSPYPLCSCISGVTVFQEYYIPLLKSARTHKSTDCPHSRPHLIDHIFGARITLILLFASLFY